MGNSVNTEIRKTGRPKTRQYVEDTMAVDVSEVLAHAGQLHQYYRRVTDDCNAYLVEHVIRGQLRITYYIHGGTTRDKHVYTELRRIHTSKGERISLVCPQCDGGAQRLYITLQGVACRTCQGLGHRSQSLNPLQLKQKALEKLFVDTFGQGWVDMRGLKIPRKPEDMDAEKFYPFKAKALKLQKAIDKLQTK